MRRHRIAVVLGIRPDVIRASLVLRMLLDPAIGDDIETTFIWSGQHYSDNLKDVFFRELDVPAPTIELGASGGSDAELVASIISRLGPVLADLRPDVVVFLGDTNTVMGSIAAAQLNIPIVHIEGCMRSYDWRMPEEKYRTTIDHLADLIYAYFDEYREQGIREGLHPDNIVVVQNLIVDVLQHYYFDRIERFDAIATDAFFAERGLRRGEYHLATCHRRENVEDEASLARVLQLLGATGRPVYFPAGYRTQRQLHEFGLELPPNVTMVDPIGYTEMLTLMTHARGVITDSGTVVEETAVLGVPSVQMRHSTERPQVYDCGSSVKFDPGVATDADVERTVDRLERLHGRTWVHGLGDGAASGRIVTDLVSRIRSGWTGGHAAATSHLPVARSHRDDGLDG